MQRTLPYVLAGLLLACGAVLWAQSERTNADSPVWRLSFDQNGNGSIEYRAKGPAPKYTGNEMCFALVNPCPSKKPVKVNNDSEEWTVAATLWSDEKEKRFLEVLGPAGRSLFVYPNPAKFVREAKIAERTESRTMQKWRVDLDSTILITHSKELSGGCVVEVKCHKKEFK